MGRYAGQNRQSGSLLRRRKIGWLYEDHAEAKDTDVSAVSDIHFELRGEALPMDHAWAMYQGLLTLAPWIAGEEVIGIHPVLGIHTGGGDMILSHRAKLVMRCPAARLADLAKLEGKSFTLGNRTLTLGKSRVKPLTLHTPLYAHTVCTGSDDELAFTQDIMRILDTMNINTRFICGRPQKFFDGEKIATGYSLMLHGLPIEHAIRVQQQGLGLHRKLGCGIFIPHKSITAVGAIDAV
jgi:CRISPR-associated protein Cas6